MNKQKFDPIQLTCLFQTENDFGKCKSNEVIEGILSYKGKGQILFQETLPEKRYKRNMRLYKGKFVNIVRRKDGSYYPFLKGITPEKMQDKSALAYNIYYELSEALNSIVE